MFLERDDGTGHHGDMDPEMSQLLETVGDWTCCVLCVECRPSLPVGRERESHQEGGKDRFLVPWPGLSWRDPFRV